MSMIKVFSAATAAVVLGLAATPTSAAVVIDQLQSDASVYMANFGQTDLAQSFTTSADNVAGGGVYLCCEGSGDVTITFGLWTNLPNAGGVEIASGSGMGTAVGQWVDAFWSPVSVTPGTTYYLTFDSPADYGVAGSTSNPYPTGNVYANPGYESFAGEGYDYTFRTYTSTGGVPEPASWALMLIGLGGLGVTMRTARRKTGAVAAAV